MFSISFTDYSVKLVTIDIFLLIHRNNRGRNKTRFNGSMDKTFEFDIKLNNLKTISMRNRQNLIYFVLPVFVYEKVENVKSARN